MAGPENQQGQTTLMIKPAGTMKLQVLQSCSDALLSDKYQLRGPESNREYGAQAAFVRSAQVIRLDIYTNIARQDGLQQVTDYCCSVSVGVRPDGRLLNSVSSLDAVLTPILSLWDSGGSDALFIHAHMLEQPIEIALYRYIVRLLWGIG